MVRGYQHNFSSTSTAMFDVNGREKKAKTMVAVLQDFSKLPISSFSLLTVGSSTGMLDNYLADHFKSVKGVDIDEPAIAYAKMHFHKDNLEYQVGDAMNLNFSDNSFDVVICSQVYEHVPNSQKLLDEIFRVLVPGGVCYFAAGNKLMWNEPHYNLPLLSVLPGFLANLYVRLARHSDAYHELHYTYWGLKKLVKHFLVHDYTVRMIEEPEKFHIEYMIKPNTLKATIAQFISKKIHWLTPGYIWILEKPIK